MNPNEFPELRSFFNEKEQIIAMPAKRKKLLLAVYYLSDRRLTTCWMDGQLSMIQPS